MIPNDPSGVQAPTSPVGQRGADLLFALAAASLFTRAELNLHDFYRELYYRVYLSLPLMGLASLLTLPGFVKRSALFPTMSWTLGLFALGHVLSATRLGASNGLREGVQAGTTLCFALSFGARYSQVSIRRFFVFFAPMAAAIMIYNIGWHVQQGFYVQWKRLYNPKALFDLLPLMIGGWALTRAKFPAVLTTVLMLAAGVIILLSGERKAYIAFIIAIALMLNPKNVMAYFVPLIAIGLVYAAVRMVGSDYVLRQVQTVLATIGIGQMPDSLSSTERAWQLHLGMALFRQDPWFGVGTNGYIRIAQADFNQVIYGGIGIHGELLRVLVENGIIGFAVYLSFIGSSFAFLFGPASRAGKTSGEFRASILWFLTLLVYVSFEGSNLMLMALQYSLAFIPKINITPFDREPLAAAGLGGRRRSLGLRLRPSRENA